MAPRPAGTDTSRVTVKEERNGQRGRKATFDMLPTPAMPPPDTLARFWRATKSESFCRARDKKLRIRTNSVVPVPDVPTVQRKTRPATGGFIRP